MSDDLLRYVGQIFSADTSWKKFRHFPGTKSEEVHQGYVTTLEVTLSDSASVSYGLLFDTGLTSLESGDHVAFYVPQSILVDLDNLLLPEVIKPEGIEKLLTPESEVPCFTFHARTTDFDFV